ncbi:hypothetical protein BU26DRAFT_275729 [Trematosphaeria pertusa]|uniref:Chorismate mutase domain-containing protein n=1 Tax=Trematosphaeria pertusa TaxID=390896 RepID=A0A6A6INC2_9PLEO|nr:uncharacterized protein BU26DRAFT_275729 [Trematosphaeria pertusa]KAF2251060.1 hypothetical protein BU26DRAFT_275729 [Trematosphaeria pertusa]
MYFPTSLLLSLPFLLSTSACASSTCHFIPSTNATASNYPGSSTTTTYPYDLNTLSSVPIASICNSANATEELACARKYIDAIDEQLAFLYARRLGYAAVAGASKYSTNSSLNDPTRNGVVAEGMAQKVLKYGGSADAGRVLGGEGCMIFASLGYEVAQIQEDCDPAFSANFTRVCS